MIGLHFCLFNEFWPQGTMSEDQRKYRNKATKLTQWIQRTMNTFHGIQCLAMLNLCLIECFLWEKEKHCSSRSEQTQKGGDKAHELGSCPNFTSLQSWPPTTPRVIILMSKSKLGVFISMCFWLLELPDDIGIRVSHLQFFFDIFVVSGRDLCASH